MRVGVLTGHIETPYVRALTTGMMAAARRHGAHLFIFPGLFERFYIGDMRQVDDRPENFMYSLIYDFALRQRLDRLIVTQHAQAGPAEPTGLVERLVDQIRVPTLFLETDAGPSLHQDDYRGMALVVEHLITAHGFRRIAYIGGDPAFPSARLRHTAFLDTMKRHGIAVDESLVQAIDFTYHAGVKGTKLLLEQDEMPEAICCASDWTAIGCQQTLRDKGLIPGKDIAVTGFHDLMEAVVNGFLQESGFEQGLYFEGYVAEDHRQVESLHGTCTRRCLAPTALGVIGLGKDNVEGTLGNVGILGSTFCLTSSLQSDGKLTEGDNGEGIGEDVVGFHQGVSFAVEGEVPVEISVVAVGLQEFSTLNGTVQPLLFGLNSVVELGKHPYFAALQPHEFVSIVNAAVTTETSKITTELCVLTLIEPERDHAVQEFRLIKLS